MAAEPAAFTFYSSLFTKLNTALTTYVSDVATSIIGAIGPVSAQLLTLYFIIYGIAMMRGVVEEPISDFIMRVVRISLILGVALNIGYYNGQIVNFLWNTPDALASYVSGGSYIGNNSMTFLDNLMSRIYDLGQVFWDYDSAGPSLDIGPKIVSVLIWVAGLVVTAYGAFLFILAKMALAILLGIGPIFIMLLLFESTKRFFESWLSQALNYLMVVVLTSGAVKLILTIIETYLPNATAVAGATGSVSAAVPAIGFSVIGALVMMQLSSVASALGGGLLLVRSGLARQFGVKRKGPQELQEEQAYRLGKRLQTPKLLEKQGRRSRECLWPPLGKSQQAQAGEVVPSQYHQDDL